MRKEREADCPVSSTECQGPSAKCPVLRDVMGADRGTCQSAPGDKLVLPVMSLR